MPNPHPKDFPAGKRHKIPKGAVLNPGGLHKGELAKKVFRQHTQASIVDALSKVLRLSQNQIEELTTAKNIPMAEQVVAKALLADADHGVLLNFEKILERILGKVPVKTEITGKDGSPLPVNGVQVPIEVTEDVVKRITENITALQRHGTLTPTDGTAGN